MLQLLYLQLVILTRELLSSWMVKSIYLTCALPFAFHLFICFIDFCNIRAHHVHYKGETGRAEQKSTTQLEQFASLQRKSRLSCLRLFPFV